jgi:hypothetical protein
MSGVMSSVESKMEEVLFKLDTLERARSLRHATMARILDGVMDTQSRGMSASFLHVYL